MSDTAINWFVLRAPQGQVFSLLFGAVAGLLISAASGAQATDAAEVDVYGDWSLLCVDVDQNSRVPSCEIVQTVRARGADTSLMRLAYAYNGRNDALGMHLTLPSRIRAASGVVFRIDDSVNIEYPIVTCENDHCYSEKLVSADDVATLRSARDGLVAMIDDATGNLQTVPISLDGFGDAFTEMVHRNRSSIGTPALVQSTSR